MYIFLIQSTLEMLNEKVLFFIHLINILNNDELLIELT